MTKEQMYKDSEYQTREESKGKEILRRQRKQ